MYILECWIEHPVRKLDQTFTYLSEEKTQRGCRVSVGFGSKQLTGFVDNVQETGESKEEIENRYGMKLRMVSEILDSEPLITGELYEMAMWMRDFTLSTAISCFSAMLPAKVKPAGGKKSVVMEKYVSIRDEEVSLSPKQLEAWIYVKDNGPVLYSVLRKLYPNQAKQLVDKEAVSVYEKERSQSLVTKADSVQKPELTQLQKNVLKEITESDDAVYLIRGVTGSGKTEIYLRLAEKALLENRQVLILVPEIALTPQMISRVSSRFGEDLAIYHSGLSPQEKYEQYRRVMNGTARIVVGTRSAVFLPFSTLGLTVMDEEHDTSYKQDSQPCYHCRDMVIWRAKYHHCKVILGSATPTLESFARALKKVYHLITMDERINQTLPETSIVSMSRSIRSGGSYIISQELREKIQKRIDDNEQVILLLNRRGYHTLLRCRSCQKPLRCPHCDLSLSWHRDTKTLKCHTCGTEIRVPRECPECGSKAGFATFGFGTEKLEEEIRSLFPAVRILRMDADTTSMKNSHEKILAAFERKEADILLGTQMIAKGLDYPDVTLVGVINGDEGLSRTDFRSCETTFDLLMQAGGRSGRSEKTGEVVFQVFDPDHYAVQCACSHDYITFFKNEMAFRHAGQYPPYTYLIALTVTGTDESYVERTAAAIRDGIKGDFKTIGVIALLKIRDRFRSRILLKGKDLDVMRNAVREFINSYPSDLKGLRIDINPMYLD